MVGYALDNAHFTGAANALSAGIRWLNAEVDQTVKNALPGEDLDAFATSRQLHRELPSVAAAWLDAKYSNAHRSGGRPAVAFS